MFIHLPNPSKRRATGSLLTPGARGGRCSKIINSNACFSIFPLKFQGLSTPPPNSSTQNQAASFKTPCCQACWFFFAVREAKRPGTHLASPPAFLLTAEKAAQVNQHQPGGPRWRDPPSMHFPFSRGKLHALQKRAGKFAPRSGHLYKNRFFIKA